MRKRVLTDLERRILRNFIAKGRRVPHFTSVVYNARKNSKRLHEDLKLLERFLKIVGDKPGQQSNLRKRRR